MKICVIEDDYLLSKVVCHFCEKERYEVIKYFDGLEAFNSLEEGLADLYFLDINLPNVDGIEILKQIRKLDKNVPVIVITASIEMEILEEAFLYGCDEYIKKPFDLRELKIRMNKILQKPLATISIGNNIEFDLNKNILFYQNEAIELRKKELRFLSLLFQNHKIIVQRGDIEDYVWEGEIKDDYPIR